MSDHPTPRSFWASGEIYESYVGRWSRIVAEQFIDWLAVRPGSRWLDVGCGTGALTDAIVRLAAPSTILGIDPSASFVEFAAEHQADPRATFAVGDAQALDAADASFDAVVSGLVLNFVPDRAKAVAEARRSVVDGGIVAAYVWDYTGEMWLMRHFWNAALALDPSAIPAEEQERFDVATPERLQELFSGADLRNVEVRAIVVDTPFESFDDYWSPFLAGQGPAPSFVRSLDAAAQAALANEVRSRLTIGGDGSIAMTARAWAVRGYR